MKTIHLYTLLFLVSALLSQLVYAAEPRTVNVNCNLPPAHLVPGMPRDRLARAINSAQPGDTIVIQGTCEESITIDRGPLTLQGDGTAVISGTRFEPAGSDFHGLVTIDGAQGVTLRGLTIRDSPTEGLLAVRGASMVVENVRFENNQTGIRLSQSNLEFRDSEVRDSAGTALMAISGSTVVFLGQAELSGNGGAGLFLEGNALGEIRGAHLATDDNMLGVIISLHSTLAMLELDSAVGSTLSARNNAAIGIQLGQGVLMVAGEGRPVANTLIESSNNGGPGLIALAGSQVLSPFGAARLVFENNPVGMVLATNASAEIRGGLQIHGNFGPGLVANGAGVVMLRSVPDPDHPVPSDTPSPSSIMNNGGPALIADFGTRLDIRDVELDGPVLCDPTVISLDPVCS